MLWQALQRRRPDLVGAVLQAGELTGKHGERVQLLQTQKNGPNGANLEPNHSHFLLVDNGKRANRAWGAEIELRFMIEKEYGLRRRVPRVCVVLQAAQARCTRS